MIFAQPTNLFLFPSENFPQAEIWYEGIQKLQTQSFTRLTIGPCKSLIVAFFPPGLNEIRKVIPDLSASANHFISTPK